MTSQKNDGTNQYDINERRERYLEKPLPSSEDSERVILGAIIIDNDLIGRVFGKITTEDFYSPLHRRVFGAMVTLFADLKPIDPITIGEELKKEGDIQSIGGIVTISNLTYGLPNFSNLDEYVQIVADKALLRKTVREFDRLTTYVLSEEDDVEDVMQEVESGIYGLTTGSAPTGFVEIGPFIDDSVAQAHIRQETGNDVIGKHTSLIDLDHKLQGLKDSHLIILAARPSVGKTALMLQIANENAVRRGIGVAVFSLEMSKEELSDRAICNEARINSFSYGQGHLSVEDWEKIEEARLTLNSSGNLYIDDGVDQTTAGMRSKIRRLNSERTHQGKSKIGLVMVDYLQLKGDDEEGRRGRSRENEVSALSRGLKKLAKEFEIPVVALSQLNRQPENRSSHKPVLSDLRESGSIEQDADVVAFLFREDMYMPEPSMHTNRAEIIIAKNRNGPLGIANARFDGPAMKFDNWIEEYDI